MTDLPQASGETLAPVAFCAPGARIWVLVVAILASSLGFIDSSVTSIAIPSIRASLGATLVQAQWISAAYLLVLASLVLAGGAMGDRFGAVRVFGTGIVAFSFGSLLCAVAPDANTLIAARVVQGAGAALMIPGSMAMIGRAYPRADRGRALGIWAAASAIMTALGPVLGGALLTVAPEWGWRFIFGVNLPLGLAVLAVLRARVAVDAGRPGLRIDFTGAALATIGLGVLAYVLTAPGAHVVALTMAGVACMAAFLWWETRTPHPMLRLGLFRDRGFAAVNVATALLYFALTAVSFYLPMTAIAAWGVQPVDLAAAFLPFSILIGGLSGPVGRLADRVGPRPLIATGAGIVSIAYALLTFAHDFWWHAVPCMVLAGFGMALVVAPLSTAVMACVSDAEQGAASGINNAVSRAAGLVAVAMMGRVAAWGYTRAGGTGSFADMSGAGAMQMAATTAGFAWVAGVAALCAGLAAVVMLAGFRRT